MGKQKNTEFLGYPQPVGFLCSSSLINKYLLSRKVEGIDPVKPWHPFRGKEGATFYPNRNR